MPIYEYKCSDCGNIFEILTTSCDGAGKVQCNKCRSDKVTKIISAGSFRRTSAMKLPSASNSGCGGKSRFS